MSRIKVIIFDFDGVIADSVDVKTKAFAELYRQYGSEIEQKVINHHLKHGGVSRFEKFRIYHETFLNQRISNEDISLLAEKFSDLVISQVVNASYIKGAFEFINENFQRYDFFISSGTPEAEMKKITGLKKISKFFVEIYGSPDKKEKHVERILKTGKYKKNETIFVGDASSDRNAAKFHEIPFVGVLNGNVDFSNEQYKINDLTELEEVINSIH